MINKLFTYNITELDDPNLFEFWYGKMNADRRKKIDAFKFDRDKKLSLAAGILLHMALEEMGIAEYEIEAGEHKKPYLKGYEDIFFNLSHSGGMAALGISDKEIGIDIEKHRHFEDSLVRYVFTERERELAGKLAALKEIKSGRQGAAEKDTQDLDALEYAGLDEVYTRFWTAKESIMKHSGLGISLEPKKIELSLSGTISQMYGEKKTCEDGHRKTAIAESSVSNVYGNGPEGEACHDSEKSCEQLGKDKVIQPELCAFCSEYDCRSLTLTSFRLSGYQLTICSEYDCRDFVLCLSSSL